MAETMEQTPAPVQQAQPQPKKKMTPWVIGCGILAILALVICCIVGIAFAIIIPNFMALTNSAEKALAQTAIRNAVTAAEQYRVENNGSYEGMTAEKLRAIDDTLRVVDESPSATQVGLSEVSANRFVLTYRGEDGQDYKATVTDGSVKYDFLLGGSDLPMP